VGCSAKYLCKMVSPKIIHHFYGTNAPQPLRIPS